MARARFIRPEFFTDEKVGGLPYGARILFAGIWCHSDLRGVFEHSARQLRVLVFPFDEGLTSGTVDEWLTQLGTAGMVLRFEAEGKPWGVVRRWIDHQDISTREIEIGTRKPEPPGWQMPDAWRAIIEKAKTSGRLAKGSSWNSSRTVLEQFQNPTPTATASPPATPTASGTGGGPKPPDATPAPRARDLIVKKLGRSGMSTMPDEVEKWLGFLKDSCDAQSADEACMLIGRLVEAAQGKAPINYVRQAQVHIDMLCEAINDYRQKETA